jgi:hypothetical protein
VTGNPATNLKNEGIQLLKSGDTHKSISRLKKATSQPYGLMSKAVQDAKKMKFTPATLNGQPTSMCIQLEYNFNLY